MKGEVTDPTFGGECLFSFGHPIYPAPGTLLARNPALASRGIHLGGRESSGAGPGGGRRPRRSIQCSIQRDLRVCRRD
jgi:hypothetical protein